MILVTGGAGYIGSHYVQYAREQGEALVVLDNLVYGHREAVPPDVPFYEGDMGDRALLDRIFSTHRIDAVVHFAAYAYVGESVQQPARYYQNNTVAALTVLEAMRAHHVPYFVFSSTCATYGNPQYVPIDERHPQDPINPYGESKLFVERILRAYDQAYGLRYVALRYFNAAGADPQGRIGESHDPETHLIPLVLQVAKGVRESVSIFGTDYDTPDGTCIRDYIHILDLAQAHAQALDRLRAGAPSDVYNLGTEQGYSVREVIAMCERVTGRPIRAVESPRRAGDPPRLVASASKARTQLDWKPRFQDLEEIVRTAWNWECNRRF
ncbi:MAG: UDP-glucose 4-epimerase GalE [Chloroherpetonaceae bacterium]|nr:UDP-glucose 4-epimerase GalE [Chthonomonadaceae bacterium]MDW8208053.1 UDP-glucose 4-epimerase GalE [Chloroherpetonaceae bacterium]